MKTFNKGGGFKKSFGGHGSFGGGNRFGGGNHRFGDNGGRSGGREFKEMFQATCADCGNSCEVPFRPTGERPVYCRDCFAKNAPAPSRDFGSRGSEGGFKKPFNKFEKKFDRTDRPAFSPRPEAAHSHDNGEIKKQLEALNAKLDQLISSIGVKHAVAQATEEKVQPKKAVAVKAKAIAKKAVKKVAKKVAVKSK